MRKLCVGNLLLQTTEKALRDGFGRRDFKVEKVTLIRNHFSGQLRGFGFVELTSHEEAQRARLYLNGRTLIDRPVMIEEACPPREGRGRPGRRGRS